MHEQDLLWNGVQNWGVIFCH